MAVDTAAVHVGLLVDVLFTLLAVVQVAALTVISWRMGRRGVWLAIPWVLVVLVATPGLIGVSMLIGENHATGGVWPMAIAGSVRTGVGVAVLLFSLLLAAVGCRRTQTLEADRG